MGKKIPFWQCILVMLVMVATLYSNPKIYAGLPDSCYIGCDHLVLDGSRYNPNHDVLWD